MTTDDKPLLNRLLPWAVLLLAALALLYFLDRGCEGVKNRPLDANVADTLSMRHGSNGLKNTTVTLDLPGGQKFEAHEGSSIAMIADVLSRNAINPNTPYRLDSGQFEGKSATLASRSEAELESLAKVLLAYPEVKIRVETHTDNSGNPDINMQLSTQQALAVQSFLTDKGIDLQRVAIVGRGQLKPLAPNDTDAGRAQNRRVEIYLVP